MKKRKITRNFHGEKNPNVRLNNNDIRLIRWLYRAGYRPVELAMEFNTSRSNISNIVARRTWRHI